MVVRIAVHEVLGKNLLCERTVTYLPIYIVLPALLTRWGLLRPAPVK